MADSGWTMRRTMLAREYPGLLDDDGKYWSAAILDEGLAERLHLALQRAAGSGVNKQFVEDLLNDCMNRIANCLSLRDRAYDLETRAIDDAENYLLQKANLEANKAISDALGSVQHNFAGNALTAEVTGDTVKFSGDQATWEKIKSVQQRFANEQESALLARRDRSTMKGSASFYADRFKQIKRLYLNGITESYIRCIACGQALKTIYGITEAVPEVASVNYLDDLAAWAQRASDKLDTELASRYLCEINFALWNGSDQPVKPEQREIGSKEEYEKWVNSGNYLFALTDAHFRNMADVRLRSARLVVKVGADEAKIRTWAAVLKPPSSDLLTGEEAYPCNVMTTLSPGSGADVYGVHNLRAVGPWQIEMPARSLGDKDAAALANLFLCLRVSYKRPSVE